MKLSELIAAYGDEKVQFQRLDDCCTSMNMTKHGTKATFETPERLNLNGFEKMGIIVWLDREDVKLLLAARPAEPTGGNRT